MYITNKYLIMKKRYYYTVKELGKSWDQTPQKSIEFNLWKQFVRFCKDLSLEHGREIRGCESQGYSNQGHYFLERK